MSIETVCAFGVKGSSMEQKKRLCYVALLQRSPVSAGFHFGTLIFVI